MDHFYAPSLASLFCLPQFFSFCLMVGGWGVKLTEWSNSNPVAMEFGDLLFFTHSYFEALEYYIFRLS